MVEPSTLNHEVEYTRLNYGSAEGIPCLAKELASLFPAREDAVAILQIDAIRAEKSRMSRPRRAESRHGGND
ncbi:MAG: hypothetical protein VB036_11545, partial [Propionicimonas sp.]|nr:hypothetical protein [Propionicimonas sp.]